MAYTFPVARLKFCNDEEKTKDVFLPSRDTANVLDSVSDDVDKIVAQEMGRLSMEEREKAYYDLHGVAEEIHEDPSFVKWTMISLQKELNKISYKPGYDLAKSLDSNFVDDPQKHLMFLRASLFKPKDAAQRFVNYLETKLSLYGPDLLVKDVKIKDLPEEIQTAIESGVCQILPLRDQAGRGVLIWLPPLRENLTPALRVSQSIVSATGTFTFLHKVFRHLRVS